MTGEISLRCQSVAAGLAVVAIGVIALVQASGYEAGSLRQIGPAVFPACLGLLMILLGAIILVGDLRSLKAGRTDETLSAPVPWRGLVFVLGGIAAFAVLLEPAGLVPAIVAGVTLSSFADRELSLMAAFLLAAGLALACSLVFIHFLKLPLDVVAF